MPVMEENAEAYRRQVQRILASQEFIASRQVREFLQYISEAALEGRTHLDQVEIAEKVLQRGKDFNPLDDASVRKLGTALRQRLERYYETEGASDPIRVTLPVRSYVPVFETAQKPPEPPVIQTPPPVEPAPQKPSRRLWIAGGAAFVASAAGAGWWFNRSRSNDTRRVFVIHTRQGDMMHQRNDVARDALLLGPLVGPADEVTARMHFTPERATQQAGILVYGDADRYVKLARQFLSRPQLEFGMEVAGRYAKPPGTFSYDPDAQTGEPIWLSVRRRDSEFHAFVSHDGRRWTRFGKVLTAPVGMNDARAGIFAHNGRSDAPSAEVRFDRLSVGLAFHDLPPEPFDVSRFPGWRVVSDPAMPANFDGEALSIQFPTVENNGTFELLRDAPPGDWTVSTRLDFISMNGSTAGLTATGPKGRYRLIRWDLDGGSITSEHLGNRQVNRKDYEGAPPIVLRITCRNGVLTSAFSRDDVHFEDVPPGVPVSALTDGTLSIGLHTSTSSWKLGDSRLPARFFYFRQEIGELAQASR